MSWEAEFRHLRMRYLDRQLRDFDLQEPDPEELQPLTEEEIRQDLLNRGTGRFLGFFSRRGLVRFGLRMGLVGKMRKRGFKPVLKLSATEPPQQLLRIYDGEETPEHLLVELAVHLEQSTPKPSLELPPGVYQFLVIDWMLLQDPTGAFTQARPKMPGQNYPGLRLGEDIGELIALVAERLHQDGVLAFPNHFHNGVLYARQMRFADARRQAEMEAIHRDLGTLSLAEQSWAVEYGCVEDETGKPYHWLGAEMIIPMSEALKKHFEGEYQRRVETMKRELHYRVNWEKFERCYQPL